jgi:flagellar hook assembly protein FlgD
MKEENSYSFPHNGSTEFEVFYGFDALEKIYPDKLVTITPYPNPFTQEVRINIGLPDLAADSKVNVVIFDNMGRQVATLDEYTNNRAYMEFVWQGTNDSGNEVPKGIYAFRVLIDGNLDQSTAGKVIKE